MFGRKKSPIKNLKKHLRAKQHHAKVLVIESDGFVGQKAIGTFRQREPMLEAIRGWRNGFKERYGAYPDRILDAPKLVFQFDVVDEQGQVICRENFWSRQATELEEILDLLK